MTQHFIVEHVTFGCGVDHFSLEVVGGCGYSGNSLVEVGVEGFAVGIHGFHAVVLEIFNEFIVNQCHAFAQRFGAVGCCGECALEVVDNREHVEEYPFCGIFDYVGFLAVDTFAVVVELGHKEEVLFFLFFDIGEGCLELILKFGVLNFGFGLDSLFGCLVIEDIFYFWSCIFSGFCFSIEGLLCSVVIIVAKNGDVGISRILEAGDNRRCSFERIYFSRGSDADIYRERKALGANVAPDIVKALGGRDNLHDAVFSFIPNTAEVAFLGLVDAVNAMMTDCASDRIMELARNGALDDGVVRQIIRDSSVRVEKAVIKDIKLRTFIAEGSTRGDLAAHVYDVTYGTVRKGKDALVVIDDSIVRGTTLRRSILRMLSRLRPRKIVVASSSPQVRYPDYYGIDMSCLTDFIAFQAAVALIRERGMHDLLEQTYRKCVASLQPGGDGSSVNHVRAVYEPFTAEEISAKISEMANPGGVDVEVVYQSIEGLHRAVPDHPGDWYFSGEYPTAGGFRLVNRAFINFYEGRPERP